MQIEVPSDKYDGAIQAMEHRIGKGRVPGISDPGQAKQIMLKGRFAHAQVRIIARFGTVESLTCDAANGVRLAGTSMGISAAVAFATAIWSGEDIQDALSKSCMTGLQIGSTAWVTNVLCAQLGRTGPVDVRNSPVSRLYFGSGLRRFASAGRGEDRWRLAGFRLGSRCGA